jgi:uncharacterized protein (TIGR02391 family)
VTLFSCFQNADDLLSLSPQDLGPVLLRLALPQLQSAGVQLEAVTHIPIVEIQAGRDYPFHKKQAVAQAVNRSWTWLEREDFIEPVPGINGRNGWYNLTDKGRAVAEGHDMQRLLAARDFPKSLLHPLIRERCWTAIMRSAIPALADDLLEAIRSAFVKVEDEVRAVGGFLPSDYGAALMRSAFHPDTGPLGDKDASKPRGERQALADLFVASYGRFRNPTSHGSRTITLAEAQDVFLLASHLLRIVDAQRPT